MKIRSLMATTLFALPLLGSLLLTPTALAGSTGVLGLYESDEKHSGATKLKQLEQHASEHHCVIRREGLIEDSAGNYNIGPADRFFLLECEQGEPGKELATPLFAQLAPAMQTLTLAEGPMSQFGQFGLSQSGANRSYIIKLSDYNNLTPMKRYSDLQSLSQLAGSRQYHYKSEAFVRVNNAAGMARPDEVVVIYYDSKEDGEKFRKQNGDLMQKIGQFNKDHLSRFSYLNIVSNR